MKTDLEFDRVKEEKVRLLEQNKNIVLATSRDNRVSARAVRYVSEGLNVVFFTLTNLKKIAQIKANSKVALCLNNVSIEGTAMIVCISEEEGKRLAEIFKKRFPGYLEWWLDRTPNMVVFVKVIPSLMVSWVWIDEKPFMEYLDLENKKAYLTIPWEKQG